MLYQIRVKGHLSPDWADWFGGLTVINRPNGEAELVGELSDQSALHGVLGHIHTLNLSLLSVDLLDEDTPSDSPLGV